jgi:glucuronate isomerase
MTGIIGNRWLVAEHRLSEEDAAQTGVDLAYELPKRAYRL